MKPRQDTLIDMNLKGEFVTSPGGEFLSLFERIKRFVLIIALAVVFMTLLFLTIWVMVFAVAAAIVFAISAWVYIHIVRWHLKSK